jgi:hypothetical protein
MGINLITLGVLFLFIFLSGFWLNHSGSPYHVLLVTLHKLIGLGIGVYLGLSLYWFSKTTSLSPIQIALIAITVLCFAINVATGSLLSSNKPMPKAVSLLNKYFPYLTLVSTGGMIYLLW